jgi:hypothetical protein
VASALLVQPFVHGGANEKPAPPPVTNRQPCNADGGCWVQNEPERLQHCGAPPTELVGRREFKNDDDIDPSAGLPGSM